MPKVENPVSSQGQALADAGYIRDPSSSQVSRARGLPGTPQAHKWDGNIDNAPDWVDRGWIGYDAGIVLNVPKGDPNAQPYTTEPARIGDTVTFVPNRTGGGTFAVQRAEQIGDQPGGELRATGPGETPTFRPAAQTEADLGDLVKTGMVNEDDMDPDARAQLAMRRQGTGAQSAEQAGNIESDETPARGAHTPDPNRGTQAAQQQAQPKQEAKAPPPPPSKGRR